MGRLIGILVIVLGVWIGFELYANGTQQALGGALSFLDSSPPSESPATNLDRVRQRTTEAMAAGHERRARMMPE